MENHPHALISLALEPVLNIYVHLFFYYLAFSLYIMSGYTEPIYFQHEEMGLR